MDNQNNDFDKIELFEKMSKLSSTFYQDTIFNKNMQYYNSNVSFF